ncbi:MAG: FecR family protein [Odoribacter sp.]|nr:FecR family protein [Odoribacter sp.]
MELTGQERNIEFALEILNHPEWLSRAEVQEWLRQESNSALYEELRKYVEAGLRLEKGNIPDVDVGSAYRVFRKQLRHEVVLRRIRRWTVAAVAVVGMVVGWQWLQTNEGDMPRQFAESLAVADIQPGQYQAVLITANGGQVVLGGEKVEKMDVEQGVEVSYDSLQGVRYKAGTASKVYHHTLRTPIGGEYKLVLADGSVVWLNSESELKYPTAFVGNCREVELTGEAYFSVAKNADVPFIVRSRGVVIRVYGTEFNVKSYADEEMNITLVEGSVSVKTDKSREYRLEPGENACMKAGQEPMIQAVNIHKYTAWKEGYFYYENERLETILKELGRWYNFDAVYVDHHIRDLRFELWADRNSEIGTIVSLITRMNKVCVRLSERSFIVSEQER